MLVWTQRYDVSSANSEVKILTTLGENIFAIFPTSPYTISEPQYQEICEFYVRYRRSGSGTLIRQCQFPARLRRFG